MSQHDPDWFLYSAIDANAPVPPCTPSAPEPLSMLGLAYLHTATSLSLPSRIQRQLALSSSPLCPEVVLRLDTFTQAPKPSSSLP